MTEHSASATTIKPGAIIEGKYRVERILGVGGMGMVVAAEHTILKQRVALKFILDKSGGDAVERFLREARATARLESPHVCRIMDAGTTNDGSPFIVMEMLQGSDLAHHLIAHGALPIPEAIDYTLQVLDGLNDAHRNGIVHRDLKPGNLFLARRQDGSTIVKLLDFGISKLHKNSDESPETSRTGETDVEELGPSSSPTNLTATGVAMGSPPYMSPEQLRSTKAVDARCDIWAMGTILYELLTGARTFPGAIPRVNDILESRYRPMRDLRADISPELEQIVARCLRVDPNDRFTSVKDLAAALRAFDSAPETVQTPQPLAFAAGVKRTLEMPEAVTRPIGSGSGSGSGSAAAVVAPSPPPASSPQTSSSSSSRYVWVVSVGLLLVLMIGVVVKVRMTPREQPTSASPPTATAPPAVVSEPAPPTASTPAGSPLAASASVSGPSAASAPPPKARPRFPAARTTKPTNTASDVDLGRL